MTRYSFFDNGEGTVINMTVDGEVAAKFYDKSGKNLLLTLCEVIAGTDQTFKDMVADYFIRFEKEYPSGE